MPSRRPITRNRFSPTSRQSQACGRSDSFGDPNEMIRRAERHDAAAVLSLAKDFATSFVVDESAFTQAFAELITSHSACLVVAEVDGKIVGYVLAFSHQTFYANGRVAWVEELMVGESFRRAGIGRDLVTEVENWSAQQGCQLIALATRRAAEFYKVLDYKESAIYFRKLHPGRPSS